MSESSKGRAREHKVRNDLTNFGWELIARSAASRGPADLVVAHADYGVALIQVGTMRKTLGPGDRARLLHAAWLCSAHPVVAQVIPEPGKATVIHYWRVTTETPSKWLRWVP